MLLKDYLKVCKHDKIRICCQDGVMWVYIGTRDECDPKKVTKDCIEHYRNIRTTTEEKTAERIAQVTDFGEREVVETYMGDFEPDMECIVVTGIDGWIHYDPDIDKLDAYNMNTQGAERLVQQLYKNACMDYISAIKRLDWPEQYSIKRFILKDKFNFLTEPENVIRMCKRKAEIEMGNLSSDCKEWVFTFGVGHKHAGKAIRFKGDKYEATEEMNRIFGNMSWEHRYSADYWDDRINTYKMLMADKEHPMKMPFVLEQEVGLDDLL